MNRRDARFVKTMRSRCDEEDKDILNLLGIVDELDSQLQKIKDAIDHLNNSIDHLDSISQCSQPRSSKRKYRCK